MRIGDTRRTVARTAASLPAPPSASIGLPGIPDTARFPNTLPTFTFGGVYGQIGSPPNTATDFGTSVTQVADTFSWQKGRHVFKLGGDLRWERLNVIQPPSPTGVFAFSNLFTDQPGVPNTGTQLASFLLGQVATFSIDLQQDQIRNRAHFQEYFVQDDWRINDRITVNAGLRYTLNFPSTEENNQVAVLNLETAQLEYLGRDGNPRAARELHKDNFGPRLGSRRPHHRQDRCASRLRQGVDRDGRDNDPLHDAGLSLPADRLAAHAGQHQPGSRPGEWSDRGAGRADA